MVFLNQIPVVALRAGFAGPFESVCPARTKRREESGRRARGGNLGFLRDVKQGRSKYGAKRDKKKAA